MNEKQRHIHKLKRHKFKSGNIIYFCVDDCKFKIAPALSLGKSTICWRCGKIFQMNAYSIRLAEPHCEDCHRLKNSNAPFTRNVDNLVIKPSAPDEDLVHPIDLGIPLSERLKRAVNHTTLDMDSEGEDEI